MAPHERRVLANWPEPLIRRGIAGGAGVYPFLLGPNTSKLAMVLVVGVAGFEPTTSSSRTKRATKLRHTPKVCCECNCFIIAEMVNQSETGALWPSRLDDDQVH